MAKTVIAVFNSEQTAKDAVQRLRQSGFDREISLLAKDKGGQQQEDQGGGGLSMGTGNIGDGITAGGALGGLAGLVAGAGALAIPGLGPLFAAGPIAGLLSGAATGGIAGGLIDWGIPESEGRRYESELRQGRILVSVRCNEQKADEARQILQNHGANEVKVH